MTTNPTPLTPKSSVKLADVAKRLDEIGLYDKAANKPVFGWKPVIYGWRITNSPSGIFLNGVPWDGQVVPWNGKTPYDPVPG